MTQNYVPRVIVQNDAKNKTEWLYKRVNKHDMGEDVKAVLSTLQQKHYVQIVGKPWSLLAQIEGCPSLGHIITNSNRNEDHKGGYLMSCHCHQKYGVLHPSTLRLQMMTNFHLCCAVFLPNIFRKSASRSLVPWYWMRLNPFRLARDDGIPLAGWAASMYSYIWRMHCQWEQKGWNSQPSTQYCIIRIKISATAFPYSDFQAIPGF